MVDGGAILLGEVGGGVTLGGGGMDYLYIPVAFKEKIGVDLEIKLCRDLKWAALGRHIKKEACDLEQVQSILNETGLTDVLSAEEARDIIFATVLPPFDLSLQGFQEATDVGKECGVPVLVHNSAPSDEATIEAARQIGPMLIAAHTNHSTFTVEESLANARELRRLGATIEVCTLDLFGAKQLEEGTDYIYALLQEELVDTWATDYAAGLWDCQLVGIEATIQDGQSSLPALIAMASANVVEAVPRLGDRGILASQKVADIVVAPSSQISNVREVIIGGEIAYRAGLVL
jgi:hypothetical protein